MILNANITDERYPSVNIGSFHVGYDRANKSLRVEVAKRSVKISYYDLR